MSLARAAVATVTAALAIVALVTAASARAAVSEPLFAFVPAPAKGENPPKPPPGGYLNGPCGLAVGSGGAFYISDHYHDVVDSYNAGAAYSSPSATGATGYLGQLAGVDGPCGLAIDASGRFYVNVLHGAVLRFASFPSGARTTLDPGPATGIAVDPATGVVYVDDRTHLVAYEPSGAPLEVGGEPLAIGLGTLEDGYGVAVSAYPATAGFLYVPDAATNTVKVYDPATDTTDPVGSISGPPGGFTSLRDSAVAVDAARGDVYVLDNLSPGGATQSIGIVDVFDSSGAYLGHLADEVVDGLPSGLAVDNSGGSTQGRVYVSSGNTMNAGVYAYPPGSATTVAPSAPSIPASPAGGESLFPTTPIGGSTPGGGGTRIECQGDGCQILPPEPTDPVLDTLLAGRGDPKPHYRRQTNRRSGQRSQRHHRHRHGHGRKGDRRTGRSGKGHRRDRPARASRITVPSSRTTSGSVAALPSPAPWAGASAAGTSAALAPGEAGFSVDVPAADGGASAEAGSHPYRLSMHIGLDQGDLRGLGVDLPSGLLVDPVAVGVCGAAQFAAVRPSPFEAGASGEDCPAQSQVGVVRVETGVGAPRTFGLFELEAATGAVLTLGASPYGQPLVFKGLIEEGEGGLHLNLRAEAPAALRLHGLTMDLWGAPWDAAHDARRGDCLNEAEPSFGWCREAASEPAPHAPLAFLTLPTECTPTLAFTATTTSWQDSTPAARQSLYRDSEGNPVPLGGCASLRFPTNPEGLLSVRKASSSSGFVLRLDSGADPGLANPRGRAAAQPRAVTVQLPRGVTLNPSMGAGLGVCAAARYAAESATGSPGSGCPDESKIGDFTVRVPFYKGELRGAIYLAAPHDNPFDSLLAVYVVARAADRGVLVKLAGRVTTDPTDGTLSATFEDLPQLPYTELEVNFRSGQRAPLISPASCGPALTRSQASPWSGTAPVVAESPSPIDSGIEGGPCPSGAPPFSPRVSAGGVNSAGGTYTPYFVHLSRSDTEKEITSYSLVLPRGITAKLAGIPFCPDEAIDAARHSSGVAEAVHPSCPASSQVGRTVSGYGVGPSLSYAEGRIYLAGPYHGSPLSLVTIDAATVGPFDLGTIVVRSAFDLDPRTAQLRINSAASDPIPHILDGVVLHLRDIRIYMDRHEFTHNPTSCEPSRLESTLTGSGPPFTDPHEATASATSYFQLLDCRELPFGPRLGLRLRGGVGRGAFPSLRATFAARPGDADLKRITVAMPHAEFLAQGHIRAICAAARFAAGTCPPGSVYGRAVAVSPLLSAPLRGDVYLRSSAHKLPDLVADLRSGSIRIDLEGRIGTSKQGGILAYFDELPDAPIERFTMTLRGGRHGLLTNSVNICLHPPTASVQALGQNNSGAIFSSVLRGQCKKKKQQGGAR